MFLFCSSVSCILFAEREHLAMFDSGGDQALPDRHAFEIGREGEAIISV